MIRLLCFNNCNEVNKIPLTFMAKHNNSKRAVFVKLLMFSRKTLNSKRLI